MKLITEILRGIRDTHDAEHPDEDLPDQEIRRGLARAALLHDEPMGVVAAVQHEDLQASHTKRTTTFRMADGTSKLIPLHANFRSVYRDEYTNEPIPNAWVQSAIQDEVDYFNSKVWVGTKLEDAQKEPGSKIISCRWVVCNKGDMNEPDVRARLAAK